MAAENDGAPAKKSGAGGIVMALLAVSVLGGGAGAGFGYLKAQERAEIAERPVVEDPSRSQLRALAWREDTAVARLEPVVTNLARPAGSRVRIQGAMVFDTEVVSDVERLRASVSQDILAFMRTVGLGELRGASALNHLRDDLNANVRASTDGAVIEILIEQLVIQ